MIIEFIFYKMKKQISFFVVVAVTLITISCCDATLEYNSTDSTGSLQCINAVTNFSFVNAESGLVISSDVDVVDYDNIIFGTKLNIIANTVSCTCESIRSVMLEFDNPKQKYCDQIPPYSAFGDTLAGGITNYYGLYFPLDTLTVKATPYVGYDCDGIAGISLSREFVVKGCLEGINFYDADTDILLSTLENPPCNINLQASVSKSCSIGMEYLEMKLFDVDGKLIAFKSDSQYPYTLFGHDSSGLMNAGNISAGTYKFVVSINGARPSRAFNFTIGACPTHAPSNLPSQIPTSSPTARPSRTYSTSPSSTPTINVLRSENRNSSAFLPSISVNSTVYLSNDNGNSCASKSTKSVVAVGPSVATFCFQVLNTGNTALVYTVVTDPILSFSMIPKIIQSGDTATIYVTRNISSNFTNTVTITGNPSLPNGTLLENLAPVNASDSSNFLFFYPPTMEPSLNPSTTPSVVPTGTPSRQPSAIPSAKPSETPSTSPSNKPITAPSSSPSVTPSADPTSLPSSKPSTKLTRDPSSAPSVVPSIIPSSKPSGSPSCDPSSQPSSSPSASPTASPSASPSAYPSVTPSKTPSEIPSEKPSQSPSVIPSAYPSNFPTVLPSALPSAVPSSAPTHFPSLTPSATPTVRPSPRPENVIRDIASPAFSSHLDDFVDPASSPLAIPSLSPSTKPLVTPSATPSKPPIKEPVAVPSITPTLSPFSEPSMHPIVSPSSSPHWSPTTIPSLRPSANPNASPSSSPTKFPSSHPSASPSSSPSNTPTTIPSINPTENPSGIPSLIPSKSPTQLVETLMRNSTRKAASESPSSWPSNKPIGRPSVSPTSVPSRVPSKKPSSKPSRKPSKSPSSIPSQKPSSRPSVVPSQKPSSLPSSSPSHKPTTRPSVSPSRFPTTVPTIAPTFQPFSEDWLKLVETAVFLSEQAYENTPSSPPGFTFFQKYNAEPDAAIVARKDRYCFLAFRGTTKNPKDILQNINLKLVEICPKESNGCQCKTGQEFYNGYFNSYKSKMEADLDACMQQCANPNECLVIAGHSQGGAFASVAGILYHDRNPYVFSIGGAPALSKECGNLHLDTKKWFHLVNAKNSLLVKDALSYDPVGLLTPWELVDLNVLSDTLILSPEGGVAAVENGNWDELMNLSWDPTAHSLQLYSERIRNLIDTYDDSDDFALSPGYTSDSMCSTDLECQSGNCVARDLTCSENKKSPCKTFTIKDIAEVESPLFQIGNINVMDLIFDQFESAVTDELQNLPGGFHLLLPRMVCAGDVDDLSALGEAYGVASCGSLDFLADADVLGFGIEKNGQGFCAGINTDTHTYAIGQTDILPSPTIGGILTISLDALGFSLTKQLSKQSLNKLWDGTKKEDYINVFGHVVIRGTGSIGFRVSSRVKCTIDVDTTLLIDADYLNNGVAPLFAGTNDSIDFALLVSGQATPKFEVTRTNNGKTETQEIDLSSLVRLDVDVYLIANGQNTALQLAASLNIDLQGLCDASPYLSIVCDVFDGSSGFTGALRAYAKSDGFGIQWAIEGRFSFNAPILNEMVGWNENGLTVGASLNFRLSGQDVEICATLSGTVINNWCINPCTMHSNCNSNSFCSPVGVCFMKQDPGAVCLANEYCKSGICVAGFCSECPRIDSQDNCPSDKFCTQSYLNGVKLGYRCELKREVAFVCSNNVACKSGLCVGGFCSECPTIDSQDKCPNDKFCTQSYLNGVKLGYRCELKRDVAFVCSNNVACKSGLCVGGFCSECPKIDVQDKCSSDKFCTQKLDQIGLRCDTKRDLGGACLNSIACKSGLCVGGFCSECPKIDVQDKCSSDKFCTQKLDQIGLRCDTKRDLGGACLNSIACKSGLCVGGFCSECPKIDVQENCSSDKFCTQKLNQVGYRCDIKRDVGGTCSSSIACKSGRCVGGFCSECSKIDTQDGCSSDKFCTQKLNQVGLRCETKRDLGGACLNSIACKSGRCVGGFCSECPQIDVQDGCSSDKFCTQQLSAGYRCETKRDNGGTCSSSIACKSGRCIAGFCSQCSRIDSQDGCANDQFCTQQLSAGYRCEGKRNDGGLCSNDVACKSGYCLLGFCSCRPSCCRTVLGICFPKCC